MLAFFGFSAVGILLFLVLTKRTTVHFALTIPPLALGLAAGFSFQEMAGFIGAGIGGIAATGIMLTFAVLYFGVMFDAGMFAPIIRWIIKVSRGDPAKIALGTAFIAILAHLGGSGASTALITISAMLPVYKALKMNRLYLAAITGMGAGTMNLVPWGGPTLRAAIALDVNVAELFNPLIPVLLVGLAWVLLASYLLGRAERRRLGLVAGWLQEAQEGEHLEGGGQEEGRRGKRTVANLVLTIILIIILVKEYLPLPSVFLIGLPLALVLNYKQSLHQQKIEAHSRGAIYTSSIIFSAGVFTGILRSSGMIEAMSLALVKVLPGAWGAAFPFMTGITGMPLSLFFDPDSYYFGVLPVLSGVAATYGIEPLAMARAAVMGQTTTGFPVSPLVGATWLLLGLAEVELGDLQKILIPRAFMTTVIMVLVALVLGLL